MGHFLDHLVVQHVLGLVQHDELHVVHAEETLADELLDSARGAHCQLADLGTSEVTIHGAARNEGGHTGVRRPNQLGHLYHLNGCLPGWDDHQNLRVMQLGFDQLQSTRHVANCLSCATLVNYDTVLTTENLGH